MLLWFGCSCCINSCSFIIMHVQQKKTTQTHQEQTHRMMIAQTQFAITIPLRWWRYKRNQSCRDRTRKRLTDCHEKLLHLLFWNQSCRDGTTREIDRLPWKDCQKQCSICRDGTQRERGRERVVDWQICHEKQLLLQLGGRDGLDSRCTCQMSCAEGRIKMGVLGCRALWGHGLIDWWSIFRDLLSSSFFHL